MSLCNVRLFTVIWILVCGRQVVNININSVNSACIVSAHLLVAHPIVEGLLLKEHTASGRYWLCIDREVVVKKIDTAILLLALAISSQCSCGSVVKMLSGLLLFLLVVILYSFVFDAPSLGSTLYFIAF